MKRKLCLLLLGIIALGIQPIFAQSNDATVIDLGSASDDELNQALQSSSDIELINKDESPSAESTPVEEPEPDAEEAAIAEETEPDTEETVIAEQPVVPYRIRNNRYFQESQRYARLAQGAYTFGDYDSSANFAYEAILYAGLSDEYVAMQMKIREANSAIAAAKYRIDWAVSSGASKQYPVEYRDAETWFNEALSARIAEEWDNAIDAAYKVIELLAYIDAPEGTVPLPARYTVRAWTTFKDCLWNIAARPWVYGDPYQWRVLYNANKSKLPDPDNPDIIEPGMVLDIPSLKGETREGAWDGSRSYPQIRD